jgi:MFS family permease
MRRQTSHNPSSGAPRDVADRVIATLADQSPRVPDGTGSCDRAHLGQCRRVIARRTVVYLGSSQLVCWGISYYPIGELGVQMTADLGWSRAVVYGGFSFALAVMGLASSTVGRLIDRHGGRSVMAAGSVLMSIGCAGLAWSHGVVSYYLAWMCLGLAMRCTLYDAAFATLVRIGGPEAPPAMSRITLPGGLASTVFWPIGHVLAASLGWRGAELVYAGIAAATVPLHLALPRGSYSIEAGRVAPAPPRPLPARDRRIAIAMYLVIVTLTSSLNTGMSAHMIGLLSGLGLAAATAVSVASLRGVGQVLARLTEVMLGGRLHPLDLNLIATSGMLIAFVAALVGHTALPAVVAFSFLYGASNGVLTITRGTVPLALFGHRGYGSFVGSMLIPGYVLSAIAPMVYALMIERIGPSSALVMSAAAAAAILAAAVVLKLRSGYIAKASTGSM